jgi:hypothetical protein
MKNKILFFIAMLACGLLGAGVDIAIRPTENGITVDASYTLELSKEHVTGLIENDLGEIIEDDNIPTVEEVDGGPFKEDLDPEAGDKGEVETFDVSSPEAFKNATLGRCIISGNIYGAQCVSLARSYWFSYAGRDISTCGTGMAKGMMNCAEENAGDDFSIYWADDKLQIQAGDWLVFDGGLYGHVGMAVGPVVNGYVTLLGENQGGHSCGVNVGGAATNIINISVKNLIGFYRPKAYIKPEPAPLPKPDEIPISGCRDWWVEYGDTMSKIMLDCEGTIHYGEPMNQYARSWYSTIIKPEQSVYDGWNSPSGVGLYEDDLIEHRINK